MGDGKKLYEQPLFWPSKRLFIKFGGWNFLFGSTKVLKNPDFYDF